jgi:UDP-N-acetylglucosamine 2-epimerase
MSPDVAVARAITYFTVVFKSNNPKLVVVLGDRYETHAAALAAHFLQIPIAHIHGGEITTGSFDNALRHGITQMSHLHFCATKDAADKVGTMLGYAEGLWYTSDNIHLVIHLVGAPGLDTIAQGSATRGQKGWRKIMGSKTIVVSYYPETCSPDYGLANLEAMLKALVKYTGDHAIFFSRVNNDPGSDAIEDGINAFIKTYPTSASWISPNTREQYLHLCEHAAVAVGNSSSLVIECPWMGLPSVLVGDRQDGRPMAYSVFRGIHEIDEAIAFCGDPTPIYKGGSAPKIAGVIRGWLDEKA